MKYLDLGLILHNKDVLVFFAFICLKVSKLSEILEIPCPKSDLGLGFLVFSSHDQTAHLLSQCVAGCRGDMQRVFVHCVCCKN